MSIVKKFPKKETNPDLGTRWSGMEDTHPNGRNDDNLLGVFGSVIRRSRLCFRINMKVMGKYGLSIVWRL